MKVEKVYCSECKNYYYIHNELGFGEGNITMEKCKKATSRMSLGNYMYKPRLIEDHPMLKNSNNDCKDYGSKYE